MQLYPTLLNAIGGVLLVTAVNMAKLEAGEYTLGELVVPKWYKKLILNTDGTQWLWNGKDTKQ